MDTSYGDEIGYQQTTNFQRTEISLSFVFVNVKIRTLLLKHNLFRMKMTTPTYVMMISSN